MGAGASVEEIPEDELDIYRAMKEQYIKKKSEGASEAELAAVMKNFVDEVQALDGDDNDAEEDVKPRAPVARGKRQGVSAESSDAKVTGYEKKVYPKSDETKAAIRRCVQDNFLFSALDATNMSDVIDAMFEKRVSEGETVITQGESGDNFYIIQSGLFDAYVAKAGDKPVYRYDNKGSFGELALMYNCPRAATVKAASDGVLWVLDRLSFRMIILTANRAKAERYELFLKQVRLFDSISEGERGSIGDTLMAQEFNDGDVVYSQGDSGSSPKFYIVERGTAVATYTRAGAAEPSILAEYRVGEYFGEHSLIEKCPRNHTVKASGALTVAAIDAATFERLMGPVMSTLTGSMYSFINLVRKAAEDQ